MKFGCEIIFVLFAVTVVTASSECRRKQAIEITADTSDDEIRDKIHVAYKHRVLNAPKIITSIQNFPSYTQKYAGYRFLIYEMKQNDDLYTKELMMVAYQLHLIGAIKTDSDEHIKYIRYNLPESVKDFPWNDSLIIKNLQFRENLASVRSEKLQVSSSSYHATSKTDAELDRWVIQPVQDSLGFRMYEKQNGAFLYAGNNTELFDYERRNVTVGNELSFESYDAGDFWMFEPQRDSSSFRIYNLCYGEYLYLLDMANYNPRTDDRPALLWRKYGCDGKQCEFFITTTESRCEYNIY